MDLTQADLLELEAIEEAWARLREFVDGEYAIEADAYLAQARRRRGLFYDEQAVRGTWDLGEKP